MSNLPRIDPSKFPSDRIADPQRPSYWFVSVWYFGGREPGEIATFPTDKEDEAVAFYEKTLADAKASENIKEVMLCHAVPTFHPEPTDFYPNGQTGRATVIALWQERWTRKGKWHVHKSG